MHNKIASLEITNLYLTIELVFSDCINVQIAFEILLPSLITSAGISSSKYSPAEIDLIIPLLNPIRTFRHGNWSERDVSWT